MAQQQRIDVLNRGFVILHDTMGSDLTTANAARVSYDKKVSELTDRDRRLISFLAREGHTSPFRHSIAQFEVYAPLYVARQWWKYVIGSAHMEATGDSLDAWNESSRRYITEALEFHVPESREWRSAPENSKQGSGAPLDDEVGEWLTEELVAYVTEGERLYEQALHMGAAPEQARLFLPAYGMYVRWYWTASLQSISHFLNQRLEHDAQYEIQMYAKAILELIEPHFPTSVRELVKNSTE